jgi:hypothetical protein
VSAATAELFPKKKAQASCSTLYIKFIFEFEEGLSGRARERERADEDIHIHIFTNPRTCCNRVLLPPPFIDAAAPAVPYGVSRRIKMSKHTGKINGKNILPIKFNKFYNSSNKFVSVPYFFG